jgi:hypothetical protein
MAVDSLSCDATEADPDKGYTQRAEEDADCTLVKSRWLARQCKQLRQRLATDEV